MDKYSIGCNIGRCLDDRRTFVRLGDIQRFIRNRCEENVSIELIERVLNEFVECGWLIFEGDAQDQKWIRYISPDDKKKIRGNGRKKRNR